MSVVTPFQPIHSEKDFSELKNLLLDYPDLTQNADSQCWDMLAGAKLQNIEPNTILFHENMVCEYFMLIVEGCIRVLDRKSVVQGKSVDLGGRRIIKKKKKKGKKKKEKRKRKKEAPIRVG